MGDIWNKISDEMNKERFSYNDALGMMGPAANAAARLLRKKRGTEITAEDMAKAKYHNPEEIMAKKRSPKISVAKSYEE